MSLQIGSFGNEVRSIQFRLNARIKPVPRLRVNGRFEHATEAAVLKFQAQARLKVDGVVGARTWAALRAPISAQPPPHVMKFIAELGTVDDFVNFVAALERAPLPRPPLFESPAMVDFVGTGSKKRYLLVMGDGVGVIDFRHFFAAAGEAFNGARSRGAINADLGGGSPAATMFLGIGNELVQCVGEKFIWKGDSCFSPEDLGSNRLGANFGDRISTRRALGVQTPVSQLLREYLTGLRPAPPAQVNSMKAPGQWDQALEILYAIATGFYEMVQIKPAY